jgi:hypothetical protein
MSRGVNSKQQGAHYVEDGLCNLTDKPVVVPLLLQEENHLFTTPM